jgi:4-hydroxy-2-oxoheptanedioate aldolase
MAERPRLHGIIKALEEGHPAFIGSGTADSGGPFDGLNFEQEHAPYDVTELGNGLLSLLDRRRIAEQGITTIPAPIVRIPPNGGQANWIAKQVLDIGFMGIIWPHVDTVEEAYNAVAAMRYPKRDEHPLREPFGRRGDAPFRAATYWGVTAQEYYDRADLWPLDPKGEIICCLMIESPEGVRNLPKILEQVPGIGIIFTGEGDYSQEMGVPRQYEHPEVKAFVRQVLDICKAHNVPNGWYHTTMDNVEEIVKDGYRAIMAPGSRSYALANKGRAAAGRA